MHKIDAAKLCVTKGKLTRGRVDAPTFRAVATQEGSDAMGLEMIVRGSSTETRALASGQQRRQVGLKLRAADACNLVYVMWRLDPAPMIEVSLKHNPGQRMTSQCGSNGYFKVKPDAKHPLPDLLDGKRHELRAEIAGDSLVAWVDGELAWEGVLPPQAAELAGPAGLRSDNLDVEIIGLSSDSETKARDVAVTCVPGQSD